MSARLLLLVAIGCVGPDDYPARLSVAQCAHIERCGLSDWEVIGGTSQCESARVETYSDGIERPCLTFDASAGAACLRLWETASCATSPADSEACRSAYLWTCDL